LISVESYQCDEILAELDLGSDSKQPLTFRQQRQIAAAYQLLTLIASAGKQ